MRSQSDSALLRSASGKTLKRLGKNALRQNDPATAVFFLEPYVKNRGEDAQAKAWLGKAYMEIRDYDRAQSMFLNAYNTDKEKAPLALYYHAQMQKSNGLYDSARMSFQRFKKEYKGPEKALKRQAGKEIAFCDSVKSLARNTNRIAVQRLDTSINKVNAEGAPVAINDSTLLYTSLRTEKIEYVIEDDTTGLIKKKIYVARRRKNKWHFEGEYRYLNDPVYNNGNVCFSPDRKRIYFTRCRINLKQQMICAIYRSEKSGEEWSDPVKLPREINDPKYTSTMPAVTTDPVKGGDVLYFVSNRRKGRGGLDIWYTVYDKKKHQYNTVKNAGSKINTSQDEITPFFDNETHSLFFSSDGWGGLGGYDIFRAKGDGKRWTGTENIGQPLNTGADDVYFTISTNRQEGFFASNRKGGNSIRNSTCCDDIYHYRHNDYINVEVIGNVYDALSDLPVRDAVIEVYIRDKKTREKFLVKTTTSDSLGNYTTKLEADQEYVLITKKKDFLGTSEEISTRGVKEPKVMERKLRTIRKPATPEVVGNMEYETDQYELNSKNKILIDQHVYKILHNNPEIIVEIHSHTDDHGSSDYNQRLSQKRADKIVQYLTGKGIDPKRLIGIGYGESVPVAPNVNADGSDNPEGRHKNRRTEFKITGTTDDKEIEYQEIE
jgi:outer membrane protein OmpA-like peptidoglycan-associated protein